MNFFFGTAFSIFLMIEKQYRVGGMRCQSCVAKIRAAIESVDGVESASVALDRPVTVLLGEQIDDAQIAAAIESAGNYHLADTSSLANLSLPTVSRSSMGPASDQDAGGKPVGVGTYFPLLLIVGFLALGASLIQFRGGAGGGMIGDGSIVGGRWDMAAWMADFMGGFFLVFGFFKWLDVRGFADAFESYDVIAARFRGYALVYPAIEVMLGIAFVGRLGLFWVNLATLILMSIGSIGVLQKLRQRETIRCACLGTVFNLPMTTVTLVENVTMAAMAAAMLVW